MNKKILMPTELTAENGAKHGLIGEFSVSDTLSCAACWDESQDGNVGCEHCDGLGFYEQKTEVDWTTIKEMYKKIVEVMGEEIDFVASYHGETLPPKIGLGDGPFYIFKDKLDKK
jgi:hypothetical protein